MTQDDVQAVAERLRQAGEAVTIKSVREALGYGSYRDIAQHLRTLESEGLPVVAAPVGDAEGESDAIQTGTETGLAVLDDTVDMVQAAEGALQHAKARLAHAESRVPELERQLAELREDMHRTTLRHMTLAFEVGRGMLPDTDPELKASEADMWQVGRAHREAQEQLGRAPQLIESARGGLRIAEQKLFLTEHHPELLVQLADVEAQRPDEHGEDAYRAWSIWKQQVASVRAEIAQVIREAGL